MGLARKYALLFDTYPMRNNEVFKNTKRFMINGRVKDDVVTRACDVLEKVTRDNERNLGLVY